MNLVRTRKVETFKDNESEIVEENYGIINKSFLSSHQEESVQDELTFDFQGI